MEGIRRRETIDLFLGGIGIGGAYPVTIQSMTNTNTCDIAGTLEQIRRLALHGCDIVRVAVPDDSAAEAVAEIVRESPMPVIADIHFDYSLALSSLNNGVHGLRLNPGNIGAEWKVKEVAKAAQERDVPIRIGVNSGSLEKEQLEKYGGVTSQAMVESALKHVNILEKIGFNLIKISLKASDVPLMIQANREIAEKVPFPLHLGVTEAGLYESSSIKSAVGIGTLLSEGIGDTIRVSVTGDPVRELSIANNILKALGHRKKGVDIVSCPTCGRCQVDLFKIAKEVEEKTAGISQPLKIAVMGCIVNGPGEAREADLGIAGGKGSGLLFSKGKIIRKVPESELVQALCDEIDKIAGKEV